MSKGNTPTPTRGVPVELDKTRYFRFTLGTIRKIREELGDEALEGGVKGDKLAKVFWYGLIGDDPNLSLDAVEDMIDMENLETVVAAMKKAMGAKATAEVVPTTPTPAAAV